MDLVKRKVCKKLKDYKDISEFMKRVFPKDELMPIWLLNVLTWKKSNKFTAFYEEENFIGILFTMESKKMVFVFYLAVNDKIHSKGYGSRILENLIKETGNKPITLFIETLDTSAENYEQRVKRLSFYEKNRFYNTGIKAGFKKPELDILSTNKNITIEDCKKLLRFTPLKIFNTQVNKSI